MFALWMFGYAIENLWGGKRFFIFYFVSGLGAAFFNLFVSWLYTHPMLTAFHSFEAMPTVDAFSAFVTQYFPELFQTTNIADVIQAWKLSPDNGQIAQSAVHFLSGQIYPYINIPMVGASGAIYGVLLAFGMLFPNTVIYLYFLFPLKAKWFVIIFGALELYMGLSMPGDHVAHFAHLGGMIFGFFLILYWKKKDRFRFY
jgi:membrane associated rhomboid family serine protease